MNTVTPAERIAADIADYVATNLNYSAMSKRDVALETARLICGDDQVLWAVLGVTVCPDGERVVLDRTGETDRLLAIEPVLNLATDGDTLAAEDGYIVYQGPGVLYEIDAGEPS